MYLYSGLPVKFAVGRVLRSRRRGAEVRNGGVIKKSIIDLVLASGFPSAFSAYQHLLLTHVHENTL